MIYTKEQVIQDIMESTGAIVDFPCELNTNLLFSEFSKSLKEELTVDSIKRNIDEFVGKHGFFPLESNPEVEEGYLQVYAEDEEKFKPFCKIKNFSSEDLQNCFNKLDEEGKMGIIIFDHSDNIIFHGKRKLH